MVAAVVQRSNASNLTSRGPFFVRPAEEVHAGQVVGEHIRKMELDHNIRGRTQKRAKYADAE